MKLTDAKHNPAVIPFVNENGLRVETHHDKGKITKFVATLNGDKLTAEVKKNGILKAWKRIENFIKDKK